MKTWQASDFESPLERSLCDKTFPGGGEWWFQKCKKRKKRKSQKSNHKATHSETTTFQTCDFRLALEKLEIVFFKNRFFEKVKFSHT